jgi:L-asparaginase/Glu-tRNA(Gln) amidotransferase subunit D
MRRPTPCRSSATAAEIPALPASQGMTGPIFTGTYGYRGSEIDLIASDILPAGNLSAQTRLLLGFCLRTQNGSRVPTSFAP